MELFTLPLAVILSSVILCHGDDVIPRNTRGGLYDIPISDYKTEETAIMPREILPGRSKRNVINLHSIIKCATSCYSWNYLGYGCYCGPTFGETRDPVDSIDSCCQWHDRCYERTGCSLKTEYWFPYYWECYYGHEPQCYADQGFSAWLFGVKSCTQKVCECDRVLAQCLQRYPCPRTKATCIAHRYYWDTNYISSNLPAGDVDAEGEDADIPESGSGFMDTNDILYI